ncbi:hypothetical protein GCM10025771_32790 [Niveibacterium umoris]
MTDFETDVPEQANKPFNPLLGGPVGLLRQQDQQVDIRIREELTSTVPADSDQGSSIRNARNLPDVSQHTVDQVRVVAQKAHWIRMRLECSAKFRSAVGDTLSQRIACRP